MKPHYKSTLLALILFVLSNGFRAQCQQLAGMAKSCAPSAAGQIVWFPGEGSAVDAVADIAGTFQVGQGYGDGKVGQAFSFNGEGGVILPDLPALKVQSFTIEAWVRRANLSSVSRDASDDGAGIFAGGPGSYSLSLQRGGELTMSHIGIARLAGSGVISDLNWHHVALTKSGAELRFYLDGAAAGVSSYAETFTFSTPFGVGTQGAPFGGHSHAFWGSIDELGVYSGVLAPSELLAIYEAGTAGKCNPRPRLASGRFSFLSGYRFTIQSEANATYGLEASTDLVQWTPMFSLGLTGSPVTYTDPTATNFPALRFYRAIRKF